MKNRCRQPSQSVEPKNMMGARTENAHTYGNNAKESPEFCPLINFFRLLGRHAKPNKNIITTLIGDVMPIQTGA